MDVRAAACAAAVVFLAAPAMADPADGGRPSPGSAPSDPTRTPGVRAASTLPAEPEALARVIDRPHTIAELEAGVIALPNAPISPGQRGGDVLIGRIGRGDATIQVGIHVLYRPTRSWVLGAGGLFAPSPTSDTQYGGLASLPRTHARSYFFLGGEARYVPIHYKYFEAWAGVSTGAVIIADRFTTEAGDVVPPILGVPDVTVRTEGFALGLQMGGSYYITENWIAGANLRGYHWMLPDNRQCSSIGDCATLSGSVQVFELGLTMGYRLPL